MRCKTLAPAPVLWPDPAMPASPDDSPFAGTAAFYARYRPPYPPAAFDWVVESFGLTDKDRVLDLGCGPGALAIPLAETVAEVVAVDTDAEMIAEGVRQAASRRNIRWLNARAEDIPTDLGPFKAATIGQAFHWMDRDVVLARLADLVAEGGGLALVNPGWRRPQELWELTADPIIERYLGPRVRHPGSNPHEPEHEPALRRSACFSRLTRREFPSRITRDIPSIIGFIYSRSFSSGPLFGDRAGAFEAELTGALLSLNPTGIFAERLETEVILAPKRAR